jgi:hypothetical protein
MAATKHLSEPTFYTHYMLPYSVCGKMSFWAQGFTEVLTRRIPGCNQEPSKSRLGEIQGCPTLPDPNQVKPRARPDIQGKPRARNLTNGLSLLSLAHDQVRGARAAAACRRRLLSRALSALVAEVCPPLVHSSADDGEGAGWSSLGDESDWGSSDDDVHVEHRRAGSFACAETCEDDRVGVVGCSDLPDVGRRCFFVDCGSVLETWSSKCLLFAVLCLFEGSRRVQALAVFREACVNPEGSGLVGSARTARNLWVVSDFLSSCDLFVWMLDVVSLDAWARGDVIAKWKFGKASGVSAGTLAWCEKEKHVCLVNIAECSAGQRWLVRIPEGADVGIVAPWCRSEVGGKKTSDQRAVQLAAARQACGRASASGGAARAEARNSGLVVPSNRVTRSLSLSALSANGAGKSERPAPAPSAKPKGGPTDADFAAMLDEIGVEPAAMGDSEDDARSATLPFSVCATSEEVSAEHSVGPTFATAVFGCEVDAEAAAFEALLNDVRVESAASVGSSEEECPPPPPASPQQDLRQEDFDALVDDAVDGGVSESKKSGKWSRFGLPVDIWKEFAPSEIVHRKCLVCNHGNGG